MEIQGFIPVNSKMLDTYAQGVKLDLNRISIEGGETEVKNTFNCAIILRCIVNSPVPKVEDSDPDIMYDKYVSITRGIKITTNDNLDILTNDGFTVVKYDLKNNAEQVIELPADCLKGLTIVNILENSASFGALKDILDNAMKELESVKLPDLDWENIFLRNGKNYADVYLDPSFSSITNGYTETETSINPDTGLEKKKKVWRGEYPLDRMIYTIQSNLDILMENQSIKGDMYSSLYATLFAQALQTSAALEQTRLQLYEQASQFQIKSQIEYYLQAITSKLAVLKALADYEIAVMNKALIKVQTKLYYMQVNGFKAYNSQKVFTAQLDGATTAFSAGMTEYAPSIFNNAELTSLYTNNATNMHMY